MIEEWRVIEEFPNYQVSNLGRVKGHKGIMTLQLTAKGYYDVGLCKNSKQYKRLVHRLVNETFNDKPPKPDSLTLHDDDIKTNNVATNLYWGTHQSNMNDRTKNGHTHIPTRANCHFSKLGDEDIATVLQLRQEGLSYNDIGGKFKVTGECIRNIVKKELAV